MARILAKVLALAIIATMLLAGPAFAQVPNPTVEGPIRGGLHDRPWFSSLVPLAPLGYVEEEFFFSGDSEGSAYRTRMVVRRPADPADFSGTVFVEWVNVTGGRDLETLWPAGHRTLLEEGHAYVVVSAQLVGHSELRAWDPVRYATLTHPGDSPGSFHIFEQALQAIRSPGDIDPLGDLDAEYVIATGDSQSAGRLTTYITEGYQIEGLIDGFLPGRGGGNEATGEVAPELGVPMLWLLEESQAERPADTDWQKFWYQAGAAHAPLDWNHYVWQSDMRDLGQNAPVPDAINAGCSVNRGDGYAVRAGIHWINLWVRGLNGETVEPEPEPTTGPGNGAGNGKGHGYGQQPQPEPEPEPDRSFIPPSGPRLERDESGELVRDDDGLAIGGIRYPYIEVPIAVNSAEVCPLFGNYEPFSSAEIQARYETKQDYVSKVASAADAAIAAGFLLPMDRKPLMTEARAFDVWSAEGATCYDIRTIVERLYFESPLQPCPPGP